MSEFHAFFQTKLMTLQAQGLYPYVGPVDIRAHGLDRSSEVQMPGAVEPYLSGARPVPLRPDLDTIIWYAINTNVDQPGAAAFFTDVESWFLSNYRSYGVVRPEWTKTYAFTANGANGGGWTNAALLTDTYPDTFRGIAVELIQ